MGEFLNTALLNIEQIVTSLHESNAEMEEQMGSVTDAVDGSEKEKKVEQNVIAAPTVSPTLTGDEKARYAAIGKEMFAPILSALEKMIREEKKANDMTIVNEEETVNEGLQIQYEAHPAEEGQEGTTWVDTMMEILGIIMVGALLFGPKIEEFFSGAWEWIKELFSSIGSFFDFEGGPIGTILKLVGGALSGLWTFVKAIFKGLGAVGGWIWNGIKTVWDKFITGPDGIINFGIKIVKGIVDFAKNAISWLGETIMNVILAPVRAIFGGAEETGNKAAEEAAEDVKAETNQAMAQQQVETKAMTNKAIMSSAGASAEWEKCVANSRANAKKEADKVGLKTNVDGTISDEAIKDQLAENLIKQIEQEKGEMKESERKAMLAEMKRSIKVENGKGSIDAKQFEKNVEAMAKKLDRDITFNSDALLAMKNLSSEQMNQMMSSAQGAMNQYLKIQGDANVQNEYDKKSEDEKFLMRMEEAKKSGQLAEFRIAEAREMITSSISVIKETFGSYDNHLTANFREAFSQFVKEVKESLIINVAPNYINDKSTQDIDISRDEIEQTTYNIMPLDKKDFHLTSHALVDLARENTEIIKAQNEVLEGIKTAIEEMPEPTSPAVISKIREVIKSSKNVAHNPTDWVDDAADWVEGKADQAKNFISDKARYIKSSLLSAATSWFD